MKESTKEYLLAGVKTVTALGGTIITGNRGGGFYHGVQEVQEHWDNARGNHIIIEREQEEESKKGPEL